ncbi:hypothetical protein L6R50_22055 [Myxococcota bacterium]|nr:hypothetical protein [Myxococcota bacterium]
MTPSPGSLPLRTALAFAALVALGGCARRPPPALSAAETAPPPGEPGPRALPEGVESAPADGGTRYADRTWGWSLLVPSRWSPVHAPGDPPSTLRAAWTLDGPGARVEVHAGSPLPPLADAGGDSVDSFVDTGTYSVSRRCVPSGDVQVGSHFEPGPPPAWRLSMTLPRGPGEVRLTWWLPESGFASAFEEVRALLSHLICLSEAAAVPP